MDTRVALQDCGLEQGRGGERVSHISAPAPSSSGDPAAPLAEDRRRLSLCSLEAQRTRPGWWESGLLPEARCPPEPHIEPAVSHGSSSEGLPDARPSVTMGSKTPGQHLELSPLFLVFRSKSLTPGRKQAQPFIYLYCLHLAS